jgi:hypothetical protein
MPAWPTRAIITKKRRVTPQPAVSFAPLAALHLTIPRLGDHSITGTVAGHHPCKGALTRAARNPADRRSPIKRQP